MDKNMIETLVRARALRYKQVDKEFIKSLLFTSERISNFVKNIIWFLASSLLLYKLFIFSIKSNELLDLYFN